MNNSDKPAFPAVNDSSTDAQSFYEPGLTKREYFAAIAMQGLIIAHSAQSNTQSVDVALAIEWADELLNALNLPQTLEDDDNY